jgi:hypothetical protein
MPRPLVSPATIVTHSRLDSRSHALECGAGLVAAARRSRRHQAREFLSVARDGDLFALHAKAHRARRAAKRRSPRKTQQWGVHESGATSVYIVLAYVALARLPWPVSHFSASGAPGPPGYPAIAARSGRLATVLLAFGAKRLAWLAMQALCSGLVRARLRDRLLLRGRRALRREPIVRRRASSGGNCLRN